MRGLYGMLIWSPVAAHSLGQVHLCGDILPSSATPRAGVADSSGESLRFTIKHATIGYNNPRLRKSPRFPPEERSTRPMLNLSKQTSHASPTPWMMVLSDPLLLSTHAF